jgi:hypothetical protein
MSSPRISIVIPTRDRPGTLGFALRTCLTQDFEDFEVVVSDNCSPPTTREVVESFADPRIKYVRAPNPLAMTDSLEFAVGHASGEYVTLIGDDDGYLPNALSEMDRLLELADAKALRWDSVLYNWPDIARQHYASPNTLLLPLRMENNYQAIHCHEARPMIRAAINFDISYADLPNIYCSVIHRDLFEQLRRQTGRVFKSRTPDVYAAFAVAHVAGRYHSLNAPLAIAGTSGKSTGIARHFVKGSSAIDADFRNLNDQAGHVLHSQVPDLPPIASAVADAFLYVKEALYPDDDALALDRRRLISTCLREIKVDAEEEWQYALAVCRCTLGDDADLLAWFDSAYGNCPFATRSPSLRKQANRRYGGTYLNLDASDFGVSDVAGAALLCEKLLGYQRDGLNVRLQSATPTATPLSDLQEKQAMIELLDRTCQERMVVIDNFVAHVEMLETRLATPPAIRTLARQLLQRIACKLKRRAAA